MKIKIVSPAKHIDAKRIDFAEGFLRSKGFTVEVSAHAKGQHNYFSGTDEERLHDLQDALDDETVDVILCSRGGYGTVRIIDQLDFRQFLRYPKKVLGYSDITVLHNRLNRMGYESVHCTAPLNFEENTDEALDSLLKVITNQTNSYHVPAHSLNRSGMIEEKIVGGNLSILCSLLGTDDELNTKGKILFIEDIGEAIYSVDRMMHQLKKAKVLKGLAGLLVGGMTNVKDSEIPFGKTVDEVIREAVEEYDYPVCFNFPAGHINDNRAIIFGKEASLAVSDAGSIFKQ
ncbi:LD-carboxypeptidase [Paracrocinitomix mangrovi]|uniref:S66 peptidase family protein n=1 Tax=Paracrocinitomix mangrovi TaxID=2862509 RepID=UPI001C8E9E07|nr:LD-carboxypeptidase [Paracrocinitomix mangrovi]UKN00607.1 LD-carboxypeptidase [Paracrocinitomix mangrovi]